MAEAKSPRKKTSASKSTGASSSKKPAAAKAAPVKASVRPAAKAAPVKASVRPAAKAAPVKASARPAKADPARLTRGEIEEKKEKKKNAALRVAKKSSGPRTTPAKAAPARAAPAKAAPAKKKQTKSEAAAKPKPRKRPELSASTPDAAALRRDGARELAKLVAAAGLDKKAERIEIIDIGEKVDYADFLVLMSGRSDRQVRSVADGVVEALKEKGHTPGSIEGMQQGQWVLVDYTDVIVHVFVDEARRYYDIEGLWMDATRVPFDGTPIADGAAATDA